MDYAEHSKMMEEEEQKEYLFPKDDNRLVKFNTFNKEQQLNSIYIGSLISEIGEEKYIRLKSGENEIEKDKLKQFYTQENNELRERIKRIEKVRQEREREFIQEKREIRENIKQDLKQQYSQEVCDAKNEILMLKSRWEEVQNKRLDNQQKNSEKLLFQKDEMERKLAEQRESYEKKMEELREKIDTMNNFTDVSTKKGQEGENWVYNELVRQFKSAQVDDCHSKGHKGDFTITEGDMKGMFESKNYTKNVPKREITKFKKDIENNADLRYGVLLSLKSGIVNHTDLCLEFCGEKPIVYLHDVKEEPFKIKVAYNICQLILKNVDCFDITKEETQQKLKEKVKFMTARHKRLINKVDDFSKDMKEELDEQWRDFEEFLNHINLNK
jgi:hypothetical protein